MPDSKAKLSENRIHLFDPVGLINDGYGSFWASNQAVRPRRDTNSTVGLLSYDSLTDTNSLVMDNNAKDLNGEGLKLQVKISVEDESDVSTPRLWKSSSPTSPKPVGSSPSSPNHQNHYQNMSPNSRTQAIAKGRKELMDMVRDLPESFYELSLKDIVEKKPEMEIPKVVYQIEEKKPEKEIIKPKEKNKETKTSKKVKKSESKKVKKSESKKKMVRSRSVNDGKFLLRTSVFPIFSGSKKGKKNLGGSFKIAPMPKPQSTPSGSMKGVEKDWWRRKSCISSESDQSNGLSSNSISSESNTSSESGSINGRRSKKFLPSCCFFNGRKIRGKK